ncbi:hypothetical protein H4582DRAFT_2007423 [Lactarius indigo]|nr:hypothetical protein H4582DRAFT_2007423 [Lactarius indigo]
MNMASEVAQWIQGWLLQVCRLGLSLCCTFIHCTPTDSSSYECPSYLLKRENDGREEKTRRRIRRHQLALSHAPTEQCISLNVYFIWDRPI